MRTRASAPAVVSVGVAAGVVLAVNENRRALLIQNTHASQYIALGFGAAPTTSNGIKLLAGELYQDSGPNCFSGAVYAIASGATTPTRVVEFG